eukprot:1582433-Prymnesium_polylepis.2
MSHALWTPVTSKTSTTVYELADVLTYGDKDAVIKYPDGREGRVAVADCHPHGKPPRKLEKTRQSSSC